MKNGRAVGMILPFLPKGKRNIFHRMAREPGVFTKQAKCGPSSFAGSVFVHRQCAPRSVSFLEMRTGAFRTGGDMACFLEMDGSTAVFTGQAAGGSHFTGSAGQRLVGFVGKFL